MTKGNATWCKRYYAVLITSKIYFIRHNESSVFIKLKLNIRQNKSISTLTSYSYNNGRMTSDKNNTYKDNYT